MIFWCLVVILLLGPFNFSKTAKNLCLRLTGRPREQIKRVSIVFPAKSVPADYESSSAITQVSKILLYRFYLI